MLLDTLTFINASLFLAGIVLMVASSFPQITERFPKLFLNGFLLTVVAIVLMVIAAFALS